jgi:hypothetical protein
MGEVLYRSERFRESIPTEEEIRSAFDELLEGREFKKGRKKEDDEGVYLWEIETTDSKGELVEYSYLRRGRKAEGGGTIDTVINVTLHKDGVPVSGYSAARYIDGEWKIAK